MVTSLTHECLLGAYDAFTKDIVRWIPDTDDRLLQRDLFSLKALLESRGDRYFTIDLPEASKAFESCLASGRLVPIPVPGFGMARHHGRKDLRPRLFWTLWSRVFSSSGTLKDDPCTHSIFLLRQGLRLFAKFEKECADAYTYAAVKDFFAVEQEVAGPSLDWDEPSSSYSHSAGLHLSCFSRDILYHEWLETRGSRRNGQRTRGDTYQRVFDLLAGTLPLLDVYALRGRHGPGAVSDGKGLISKYEFPTWPNKLEETFPYDWFCSSRLCFEEHGPSNGIVNSCLLAVPKSAKGPRLIASEPICNQWIQQALMHWYIEAFQLPWIRGSICIHDQSVSQRMAKEASFGHLATVDLKSASDRLSCRLVERLFRRRPEILEAMMACRTSLLRQDIDKSCPTWLTLNKFATQGSALTFPVQSFVFYCISVAACLFQKGLDVTLENVETVKPEIVVYGDDIIVPTAVYRELIDALHQLGLKVNETKSFGSGYFRESCGSDWYKGVNVTPSYIRSDFDPLTPTSIASLLEVSNNFHRNGCWSLAEFVAKRIPRCYLDKIAIEDGKLAIKGLFSFCGSDLSHLRMRYNESLMRREYLVLQVRSKRKGTRPDGVLRLRQYFTERPAPNVSWDPVAFSRSVPVITRKWSSLY